MWKKRLRSIGRRHLVWCWSEIKSSISYLHHWWKCFPYHHCADYENRSRSKFRITVTHENKQDGERQIRVLIGWLYRVMFFRKWWYIGVAYHFRRMRSCSHLPRFDFLLDTMFHYLFYFIFQPYNICWHRCLYLTSSPSYVNGLVYTLYYTNGFSRITYVIE